MNNQTDQQLLRNYADDRSEAAFAELVRRHIDLVHSIALRLINDSHLAKDVTQATFIALAQQARQLTNRPTLSGWLHTTARNLAVKTIRTDVRRRQREQEAVTMNELLSTPDAAWEEIAPQLDAALGDLNEAERDAVLLRYFEKKSAAEIATTLGITAEAAQKRASRAVERLREMFVKRGVTAGAGGLAVVISANAVQAAPIGLAATISGAAILAGTAVSTSAVIAATKTIAMTTLQKTLVTATVALLAGAGIYEARLASQLREQNQTLQQQHAPLMFQIEQLQRDGAGATNHIASLAVENNRLKQNSSELLRLRGEMAVLRRTTTETAQMQAKNPATSSPTKLLAFAKEEMLTQATNTVLREVRKLKDELKLTPEQTEALQNVRFKYIPAHARQTFGEFAGDLSAEEIENLNRSFATEKAELTAVLTPEQQAIREQNIKAKESNWAQNSATAAVAELTESLNLTPAQQAAMIPVLTRFGPVNAMAVDAQSQLDARLNALKGILTPEQLQAYRQQKQATLEQVAKMKQALLSN